MNRPHHLALPHTVLSILGLLAAVCMSLAIPANAASSTTVTTYIVLYHEGASTATAEAAVTAAGGSLVANYTKIGVVVARSTNAGFATAMKRDAKVEGVAATNQFATKVKDVASKNGGAQTQQVATWGDSLSAFQWDMRQIHVPEAHEVTPGSRSVLVGDIDTGLDFTHPDLAPNYDAANSTDCSSGTPQPLVAGNDRNGHGTHTAGTIAAAANGVGIVGVAANVRIAGIKSSNDDGFFFPEMVICSFVWAATHGMDVTNNSYFADPWLFNCKNDPVQRAIWAAERRAIRFAQSKGVLVVAAEGNESTDLSHPTVDVISPDFPPDTEQERTITNACAVVPVEVPGVVGVTATGNLQLKSFYSSYGISTADVAAPGGDSILQVTPASAPFGRVLSSWSAAGIANCLPERRVFEAGALYCWAQGTSMASPHATGVAALILSAHGDMSQGALAAEVQQATNPLPCPDTSIYADFPQNSGAPQTCQGDIGHNSFYGAGEVDALKAVS
jgi:subtilisin family serine protease